MTGPSRYEHLRDRHPAVVYELVHQAELSFRGAAVPPAGPERDRYLEQANRREDEAAAALDRGVDAMIELLEQWDIERGLLHMATRVESAPPHTDVPMRERF